MPEQSSFVPTCAVCGKPVLLEHSKTDGDGKAVHEDCTVQDLSATSDRKPVANTKSHSSGD